MQAQRYERMPPSTEGFRAVKGFAERTLQPSFALQQQVMLRSSSMSLGGTVSPSTMLHGPRSRKSHGMKFDCFSEEWWSHASEHPALQLPTSIVAAYKARRHTIAVRSAEPQMNIDVKLKGTSMMNHVI